MTAGNSSSTRSTAAEEVGGSKELGGDVEAEGEVLSEDDDEDAVVADGEALVKPQRSDSTVAGRALTQTLSE